MLYWKLIIFNLFNLSVTILFSYLFLFENVLGCNIAQMPNATLLLIFGDTFIANNTHNKVFFPYGDKQLQEKTFWDQNLYFQ